MLLFKYTKITILSTAAVASMLITAIHGTDTNATTTPTFQQAGVCSKKITFCLQNFKDERLNRTDTGNPCKNFTDKILECAAQECKSEDLKKFITLKIKRNMCGACERFGFCTYHELVKQMKSYVQEDKILDNIILESNDSGVALSASRLPVLLAVLRTAWAGCMYSTI